MTKILFLLFLFLFLVDSRPFQRFFIPNASETRAVCNDGTPSAYYFKNATTPSGTQSTKWNIWLMGGFWCWNNETCNQRAKADTNMFSSKNLPLDWSWDGAIFDEDGSKNPQFYDFNSVWAWYCTSDAWSGDADASPTSPQNWEFRGKRVIRQLILSLINNHGMNTATEIVLSGCSAGSLGVLLNADFVASILQEAMPQRKYTFKVIVDSGLFFDLEVVAKDKEPQRLQFQQGVKLWNGQVNERCSQFYAAAEEKWRCYLGDYILPFIKTPLLIHQDKVDSWQLSWSLGTSQFDLMHNQTQARVANYIANVTTSTLNKYAATSPSRGSYIWEPACVFHCMLTYAPTFTFTKIQSESLAGMIQEWFPEVQPNTRNLIDSCDGFYCSEKCP